MEEVFKCPECNSSQTRFRVRSGDRICYCCGNTWNPDIAEEQDG